MKTLNSLMLAGLAALALTLGTGNVAAQPAPGGGGGGGFGGGNFDPVAFQQQMQQRMIDSMRTQLAATNDEEWKIIEPRLTKVVQLRMETMMGGMGGFRGMMGGRGGGGGGRGLSALTQTSPEAEALQKAIDDNAPAAQIKAALEKVRAARKAKAAETAKAQEQLRQVLTVRQEAVMVSMSMLE